MSASGPYLLGFTRPYLLGQPTKQPKQQRPAMEGAKLAQAWKGACEEVAAAGPSLLARASKVGTFFFFFFPPLGL